MRLTVQDMKDLVQILTPVVCVCVYFTEGVTRKVSHTTLKRVKFHEEMRYAHKNGIDNNKSSVLSLLHDFISSKFISVTELFRPPGDRVPMPMPS